MRRPWWVFASIVAAVLAIYAPSLDGSLLWDDLAHVTTPALQSIDGLRRIWFELGATQQYYPVLHTAFWIEHRLWGDATFGYRLLNALLHAASACLIVVGLDRLKVRGAVLAGLLFAVHPVGVESVAWISEQKNTLSLVLYLAAGLVYLRFDRDRRPAAYALASGLFVLAALTKTVTVTLPAALLVVLWWQRGRLSVRRDVVPLVPWFVVAAVVGLVTAWVEFTFIGARGRPYDLTVLERGLLAGRVIWFYLQKLAWPADLMFNYPRWDVKAAAAGWWPYTAATIGVTAALWSVRHRARGPLAAWLFFVGSLFPALGFFNVYPFVFAYVADHFQYLAAIGILCAAAAGWAWAHDRGRTPIARRLALAAAGVVVVALGVLSWRQTATYVDEATLYRATIAQNPGSYLAHANLGTLMRLAGRTDEAIEHYRNAVGANPDAVDALVNLATLLAKTGRSDEAVGYYERALQFEQSGPVHAGLGATLLRTGRRDEAISHLAKAAQLEPNLPERHRMLGRAYLATGRQKEAIEQFRAAAERAPRDAAMINDLGSELAQAGLSVEALDMYERAVRVQPDMAKAHLNLAMLLPQFNRVPEAIAHARDAVRLAPDLPEAFILLGDLLMAGGRRDEATGVYAAAAQKAPADPSLQYRYGTALLLNRRPEEALPHLREAARLDPRSVVVHENLALALDAVGKGAEAAEARRRAAELRKQAPGARTP